MTKPLSGDLQFFFGTLPQPCPYLPDRLESKIVTELGGSGAHGLHEELSRAGFRRSHGLVYKPACTGCQACIPVRVPVAVFECVAVGSAPVPPAKLWFGFLTSPGGFPASSLESRVYSWTSSLESRVCRDKNIL